MNTIQQLTACGQSVWLDNIRRAMFASGELERLIAAGVRGMTSNPTIFSKAIGAGDDYDEQLRELLDANLDGPAIFERLAVRDIQQACDGFRPLYDTSGHSDGFVSIEVSPKLARDTQGTIEEARRLWREVARPNVLVKIPGTPECLPSIRQCLTEGININITLLFGNENYERVIWTYVEALEARLAAGQPVDDLHSVASIFVSRIDTAVDRQLQTLIAKGEDLKSLLGTIGVSHLKESYRLYQSVFEHHQRFTALAAVGARVQRPLWASTGTKNPAYSDLLYVENLVGRNTVNTMPTQTLQALLDHGTIAGDTIGQGLDRAQTNLAHLRAAGISLFDVTQRLQDDGVVLFSESYDELLASIQTKLASLRAKAPERITCALGYSKGSADQALSRLGENRFDQRLWAHDATLWSNQPAHVKIIENALGWLDAPQALLEHVADLQSFAAEVKAAGLTDAVVLGMGGSSLAPDVFRLTFGERPGAPRLHVLDSSDPGQIATLEGRLDLERTLFFVSSKSGTTIEPNAFFRYFYERVQKAVGSQRAAKHFVAITDPGTPLEREAREGNFLRCFTNMADIGGRYSALSFFGMAPAAAAGYDVKALLEAGNAGAAAAASSVPEDHSPGARLGAIIGGLAKAGRDKLTLVAPPAAAAFGYWLEQLLAESTGKNGTGIVPIEGEPLGDPHAYGNDRLFVAVADGLPGDPPAGAVPRPTIEREADSKLQALEAAGQPVVRLCMPALDELGQWMYLWEVATAAAGSLLGIDAFDQPNVQESKDNTNALLATYKEKGSFGAAAPAREYGDGLAVYPLSGSPALAAADLTQTLAALFGLLRPGDYLALNAFLPMTQSNVEALRDLRVLVRDRYRVATTVGFGPRFLHSTGQLHKGGPNTIVVLQLTAEHGTDRSIPGMGITFGTLIHAQALGDFLALDGRKRRGARMHLGTDPARGLERLLWAAHDAITART
ncbi:bifunctional transaldolase/phosoglucose isomerase [bacterium]|nr:MAG: bifunctional transaldolase/phosoglucose isomerase [bacterium]